MQPFKGIRILDLTTVLAGPFCGYQLALLGAEVIKIERPGKGETIRSRPNGSKELGEQGMSLAFMTQSANKRFITLDIDKPEGRQVFLKLAATCDVIIENLRTDSMDKRGIGFEAVRALKPDIIWCAISAYGRDGPKQQHPAYDSVIQAWTGLMSLNGTEDGLPLRTGAPIVDYATGLAGAFAIASALFQQRDTKAGQYIDVSMLDTTLTLMASVVTQYSNTGAAPRRLGNQANSGNPCSATYDTKDGSLAIATNEEHQVRNLLTQIGLTDLLDDPRFARDDERRKYAMELRAEIQKMLRRKSANQWESELNDHGVPCARVRTIPEAMAEPQVAARGFMHTFAPEKSGTGKELKVPLAAFKLAHGGPHAISPPKSVGADTTAVLGEAGYDQAEIDALRSAQVI